MKNFLKRYFNLPKSSRAVLGLMNVTSFQRIVIGVFVNIYVFKLENDITNVIIYNIIYCISTWFFYVLFGYIFSEYKINIKKLYFISYSVYSGAFLFLFFSEPTIINAFIFAGTYAIGNGAYWCATSAYELMETTKQNRDFYASTKTIYKILISTISPLLIGILFYFGGIFNFDAYKALFIIVPVIYLTTWIFIKNLKNYFPEEKITFSQFKNFFSSENKYILLYFLSVGNNVIKKILISILLIFVLKTEFNVGIYEFIFTFLSILLTGFLSKEKYENNRVKLMFFSSIILTTNYILIGINLNLLFLIIFSLINIIILPIYDVSQTKYMINYIDKIHNKGVNFFSGYVFREFNFLIGRLFSLLSLLLMINIFDIGIEKTLLIGFIILGTFNFLSWLFIFLEERK